MQSSKQPTGWRIAIVLGIGILAVSTSAILIRLATNTAGISGVGFSLVLAASRLTLASIILIPTWRAFRLAPKAQTPKEPTQPSAIVYSVAAGLTLAIHFATWITSLSYTSIAASTTLVTTNPIWVALLSWVWFREKPTIGTLLGIAIALFGGILISSDGANSIGSNPALGNGLAIVGAWAASLYFLLGREAQKRGLSVGSYITVAYSVAAIALLPLPFLAGATYLGYPPLTYLYIALMALLPQLVGHTSFNWAVRHVPPTLVTLVILLEPVGSTLLACWLFQEIPGLRVLSGAAVILAGVAVAVLGNSGNR